MTIHPWCERDKALQHNVKLGHYYIKTMQSAMLKNDPVNLPLDMEMVHLFLNLTISIPLCKRQYGAPAPMKVT